MAGSTGEIGEQGKLIHRNATMGDPLNVEEYNQVNKGSLTSDWVVSRGLMLSLVEKMENSYFLCSLCC